MNRQDLRIVRISFASAAVAASVTLLVGEYRLRRVSERPIAAARDSWHGYVWAGYRRITSARRADLEAQLHDGARPPNDHVRSEADIRDTVERVFDDLYFELNDCFSANNPLLPSRRYQVQLTVRGASGLGSLIEEVEVAGYEAGLHPEVATAQACVEAKLRLIELPPSAGRFLLTVPFAYNDNPSGESGPEPP